MRSAGPMDPPPPRRSRGGHGDLSPGQLRGCFQPLPVCAKPGRASVQSYWLCRADLLGCASPFLTVLCAFCSILRLRGGEEDARKRQPSWNLVFLTWERNQERPRIPSLDGLGLRLCHARVHPLSIEVHGKATPGVWPQRTLQESL